MEQQFKDRIVELDVGGRIFKTRQSTLVNGSEFFRVMFSPQWNSENPIFIDRDPVGFSHVLNFLRDPNYPFPRETYGHELEFYGVCVPVDESVVTPEMKDDEMVRAHEIISSTKNANSIVMFNLTGLICKGTSNLIPEKNELGTSVSFVHPILRLSRRAAFQKTNYSRVSIEPLVANDLRDSNLCGFALYPKSYVDAWDDPRLVLRFRTDQIFPQTRAEFFRRGLLSVALDKVELLKLSLERIKNKDSDMYRIFADSRHGLMSQMHFETLEVLELVREEQTPVRNPVSLYDRVYAESPGELSISLSSIFKLCDGFSEECDVVPYCKDFLCCVGFVVNKRPSKGENRCVEVLDVRMSANSHVLELDTRRNLLAPFTTNSTTPVEDPNDGCPSDPCLAHEKSPNELAFLSWKQHSYSIQPGTVDVAVEVKPCEGVLHEIMFFVRQENENVPGERTLVRVREMRLQFNCSPWVPFSERELVESMAEHDWKPISPIYKLHYGGQGTDLNRVDYIWLGISFWYPPPNHCFLYVCLKTQKKLGRWIDNTLYPLHVL